jgi:hypothetical protein
MTHNAKRKTNQLMAQKSALAPLGVIRTETVFSKLPIHTLSKKGSVEIHITRENQKGKLDTYWRVSPNRDFGEPRQLAFKIDKLVINQRIDELSAPLPQIIRIGSLRDIARELDCGGDTNIVKRAFSQNASAFITAKFKYADIHKQEKQFEMQGTRYSLVFSGEELPSGETAEVVYIILNEPYLRLLNSVEKRPLDFEYMKQLTPGQLRWYELVSFKMFASFKFRRVHAKLLYSEYCLSAPQKRHYNYDAVKKQMYKIHRPHIQSGYISKVLYKAITGQDGKSDWIMYYYPGERAAAEYEQFTKKKVLQQVREQLQLGITEESDTTDEAKKLIEYFHYRIHGLKDVSPTAKAYRQAQKLIADHGLKRAQFLVDYVDQHTSDIGVKPQHFGFILSYAPQAVAEYEKHRISQEKHRVLQEQEMFKEAYGVYREQKVMEIRARISSEELDLLKSDIKNSFDRNDPNPFGRDRMVEIEIDKELEKRYGVLSFEAWREEHGKLIG